MTVYVDDARTPFRGWRMCHMLADTDDELQTMADALGLQRRWRHDDHYDLNEDTRARAVALGAVEIGRREAAAMRAHRRAHGRLGEPAAALVWFRASLRVRTADRGARPVPFLRDLATPAALVDLPRMARNVARMQARADALGVAFRPHVKTSKCPDVARAQLAAGARGVTVSTLKEAEAFFEAGIADILYAVGIVPAKLPQAAALRRRGCDLKVVVDNLVAADAIAHLAASGGPPLETWIEIDTDGHRSGIEPEDARLLEVGRRLHEGGARLGGVMTHAGSSYDLDDADALRALAERERAGAVRAAERLRSAGLPCPAVSVGSTPTALAAAHLEGVTELRAGVYVFFDLVMHNVGVCTLDELALSVLTTVIGHQHDKGWAIVDAGWMAMSRDRGTRTQRRDFGFGLVCDAAGAPIDGYVMSGANQEHGIVSLAAGRDDRIAERFPVGTLLRILPNHACATGAQHERYVAIGPDDAPRTWPRFGGW